MLTDKWQPIATAPRDGILIDLWVRSLGLVSRDSDALRVYVAFRFPDAMWFNGEWCDEDGNSLLRKRLEHFADGPGEKMEITHWMPLPPPPMEQTNAD
jgi:hypothetical protein